MKSGDEWVHLSVGECRRTMETTRPHIPGEERTAIAADDEQQTAREAELRATEIDLSDPDAEQPHRTVLAYPGEEPRSAEPLATVPVSAAPTEESAAEAAQAPSPGETEFVHQLLLSWEEIESLSSENDPRRDARGQPLVSGATEDGWLRELQREIALTGGLTSVTGHPPSVHGLVYAAMDSLAAGHREDPGQFYAQSGYGSQALHEAVGMAQWKAERLLDATGSRTLPT